MYQSPDLSNWKGRNDPFDGPEAQRWHHIIQGLDLSGSVEPASPQQTCYAFLGFCCDEGVRRNLGRTGAHNGPAAIRKALRNLSVHHDPGRIALFDVGDVICPEERLESTQVMLGAKVSQLLSAGYRPIVMGGGHEIAYGHFLGIHEYCKQNNRNVGIINIDAHFDLRNYDVQGTSGTPFLQIHERLRSHEEVFKYLVLGIDESSNTKALFKKAEELKVEWHTLRNFRGDNLGTIFSAIEKFVSSVEAIYLTLDLDAINQAYAPGVSAPSAFGLHPETIQLILRKVLQTGLVLSMDIAELCPPLDPDDRTARLAAQFIYNVISDWRVRQ
jgi:formiminoglutamase